MQLASPLRILLLSGADGDTLLGPTLRERGVACSIAQVRTRPDYSDALARGGLDLVVIDTCPCVIDESAALTIARTIRGEVPAIMLLAKFAASAALQLLNSGATDYVLKSHPSRLVPAVLRAVREAAARRDHEALVAEFIQAQKMEIVGHLARGVAHDFNNIISVIMGYSDMIMEGLPEASAGYKSAEEIRHAAERAAGLTRQLLIFSRKQAWEPEVLDPNEVIKTMGKMLRRLVGENIQVEVNLAPLLGRVQTDATYVGQVLMNLAINARDAMPGGGRLTIETGNRSVANGDREIPAGEYVTVTVRDTGVGMSDKVKESLFAPFFTTKPEGKGTGLGLATCKMIVDKCGGHIRVSSESGKGAEFTVYFPLADQPLAAQPGPVAVAKSPTQTGNETLLVVEDEPAVRELACSILQEQGYTVLPGCNGQDGLRVASEHAGEPIALVVTDVVMPQMSGKVMVEWLKATYPGLRALFTSGYNDEQIAQHGALDPQDAFLPKPYTPASLSRKVREMLDREAGGPLASGAAGEQRSAVEFSSC